ncbi:hypothetical protein Goari_005660 [Gossypium aridum]|uniref:RNase H type-1 domain-containing protein n=1 Tax=Gossypium aridum TaxID=34290 RepID=A0A7J8YRU0_GOSAI|nr:hypothetical protein [Gossypium aridum]
MFQEVEEDANVIWDRATSLSRDFCIFNLMEKYMIPKPVVEKGWKKPDPGVIKINYDATIHEKKACYGLVARDTDSFVHGWCVGCVKKDLSVEWTELQAMEESINFARINNWKVVALESDCANLVNQFNSRQKDLTVLGYRLREIQKLKIYFSNFTINWAPRCCNKVVDALCKWANIKNCNLVSNLDYPLDIYDLVLKDAIN